MIIYESNKRAASEQIGIKACSLLHLDKVNMETPEWFALGSDCFRDFIYDHRDEYFSLIKRYSEAKRQKFVKSLERTEFTDETKAKIIRAIHKHFAPDDLLAIRTSITDADLDIPFTGMYQTYLFVKQNEKLFTYIKKCYLSCFSEKAMSYRFKNNLLSREFGAAIIIQKMIDPDYSGIIFTTNPLTNDANQTLITITRGVSHRDTLGDQNSIDIIVDKNDGILTDLDRAKILLNEELVNKLYRIGQTIENSFEPRVAHDIEFVIKGDKFYIMQTRPMAEYLHIDKSKPHTILDSSMLSEGLKGVTTPLTYSFERDTFCDIQKQLLQNDNLSEEDFRDAAALVDKSICFYENKIYVRMKEYKKISELHKNQDSLKGLKKLQHLIDKKSQSLARLRVENEIFDEKFDKVTKTYTSSSFKGYTNMQLIESYRDLQNELASDFFVQVANSAKIDRNFDKLLNYAEAANIYDAKNRLIRILYTNNIPNEIARDKAFRDIIKEIRREPLLVDLFMQNDVPTLIEKLHDNALLIFSKINSFINEYGAFGVDELKLEAITLKENPEPLIAEIKAHLEEETIPTVKEPSDVAEESFIAKFRNIQRAEIRSLIETTKFLIQNRTKLDEKQVRLCAIIRAICVRIGSNFTTAGIIKEPRDVFFLEKAEITDIIERGRYTNEEIQERITKRKAEYLENCKKPYFECIHFFGAIQPENMIVYKGE